MSTGQNQLKGIARARGVGSPFDRPRARWKRILLRTAVEARGRWWAFALPLLVYLLVGGTDSLALRQLLSGELLVADIRWNPAADADSDAKFAAELAKQKYQILAYVWALALLVGRIRAFLGFLRSDLWLALACGVLALTALSSDMPERVFANLVHLGFGLLVVWIYLFDSRPRGDLVWSVGAVLAPPAAFTVAASLFVFLVNPNGGLYSLVDGARFGGIAGGPNALGGVALLGTVAAIALLIAPTGGRSARVCGALLLAMSGAAIVVSGSATSSALAAMAVLWLLLRFAYRRLPPRGRAATIMVGAVLVAVVLMWAVVQQSAEDVVADTTAAVGKDVSLTGRVDLWAAALSAFEARPVLGWGYDNHATVLSDRRYEIPYVQYHNGYLDNLVVGGSLLGAAIFCCFAAFAGRALRGVARGIDVYLFVVAFAVAALHNMTEYSLFRAGTSVFTLWLLGYVGLQLSLQVGARPLRARARRRSAVRRRSRRRVSWG